MQNNELKYDIMMVSDSGLLFWGTLYIIHGLPLFLISTALPDSTYYFRYY